MSLKGFLLGASSDEGKDTGLLVLRVLVGLSLFAKHGLEKLTGYSAMTAHFPDPIHIGTHASLAFALLTDGICSLLVVIGLATRPAAGLIAINLITAFVLVHKAAFFVPHQDHGELVVLYIIVFVTVLITGPGRFSVDARLRGRPRY